MSYSKIYQTSLGKSATPLEVTDPKRAKYRIKNDLGEYEVVYLETSADQVIETPEQQFISAAEKAQVETLKGRVAATEKGLAEEIVRATEAEEMLLNRLNALDGSGSGSITGILNEAKAYTDLEVGKTKTIFGNAVNALGAQVDLNMKDLATVDTRIETSKQSILTYVDGELSAIDNDIANLDLAYKTADATNLSSSKAYTDTQVSSAKLQLEGYTDQKLADLVGSAPETLDTLQELASALQGNQASITDILTQIGTKADKTVVANELSLKASQEYVDTQLDSKATVADLALAGQGISNLSSSLQNETNARIQAINTVNDSVMEVDSKVSELEVQIKDAVPTLSAVQPEGFGIGHVWLEYK